MRTTLSPLRFTGTLVLIAAAACTSIPGVSTSWTVASVAPLGSYLDATITRGDESLRFFAPAGPDCASVLRAEQAIQYQSLGPLGELKLGDTQCEPVGIGSLKQWRDRRPRPEVPPLPSRQATYRVEYQDEHVAILRGLFPLTSLIGFPGLGDVLVVIPKSAICQSLLTRDVATIEYRVAGPDPFVLISDRDRCPVQGLIQPPPGRP